MKMSNYEGLDHDQANLLHPPKRPRKSFEELIKLNAEKKIEEKMRNPIGRKKRNNCIGEWNGTCSNRCKNSLFFLPAQFTLWPQIHTQRETRWRWHLIIFFPHFMFFHLFFTREIYIFDSIEYRHFITFSFIFYSRVKTLLTHTHSHSHTYMHPLLPFGQFNRMYTIMFFSLFCVFFYYILNVKLLFLGANARRIFSFHRLPVVNTFFFFFYLAFSSYQRRSYTFCSNSQFTMT